MGFSRQEYWSGLLWPPPGDLPDPGIEPLFLRSLALAGRVFTTRATWEALCTTDKIWSKVSGFSREKKKKPTYDIERASFSGDFKPEELLAVSTSGLLVQSLGMVQRPCSSSLLIQPETMSSLGECLSLCELLQQSTMY